MNEWAEEVLKKIDRKLTAECMRMGDKIPYIAQDGVYRSNMLEENLSWWTNGFWAGMLWQMYHAGKKEIYKKTAEKSEEWLDRALENYEGLHHDVGFMWLHTAVADYRLTGNQDSRRRALHAANLLAGRYNPAGEFIRAWNQDKAGWMIIDCMMNISLLFWAAKEVGDSRYSCIALRHADTSMRVLMRPDGSCNHIAVLEPETGKVLSLPAGQGYESGSSWSRGQAWAIYGFALAYSHTGNIRYLDTAKRAVHYFLANVSLTEGVARVDFRAPQCPVMWDTTASACAACGLMEIADAVPEPEKMLYQSHAERILHSLEEKYCNWNEAEDGILQFGTAEYHRKEDTHVPIIYGDYFFVEGILRLLNKEFCIW